MAFKEAKSWLSALRRGAQAHRRLACCICALARVPILAPEAGWALVLKTKWAEQSSPLVPRHYPVMP